MTFQCDQLGLGSKASSPCVVTETNLSRHMCHPEYWIAMLMLPSPQIFRVWFRENCSCQSLCFVTIMSSGIFSYMYVYILQYMLTCFPPHHRYFTGFSSLLSTPLHLKTCNHFSDCCHYPSLFLGCFPQCTTEARFSTSNRLMTALKCNISKCPFFILQQDWSNHIIIYTEALEINIFFKAHWLVELHSTIL